MFFLLALPALLLRSQAQEVGSKTTKDVATMWDIEVGMPSDLVIAGLTKHGYSVTNSLERAAPADVAADWEVSLKDKSIGSFFVKKGRVDSAEILVYDSLDPPKHSPDAFGLADALYWVLRDSGVSQTHDDDILEERLTPAMLTTREMDFRKSDVSYRMIFISANGNSFRMTIVRSPDHAPTVSLYRLTPFDKKHP